ncbi:MAG: TIGR04255 family protein [Pirellulaceae bacterium]
MILHRSATEVSDWPSLSRAPIVEGLIDIRVEKSAAVSVQVLKNAADELAEEFPSRKERRIWMGQISLSQAAAASISTSAEGPDGIILHTADEKWVAQFRLDGFTFSRLNPYTNWDELRAKAAELWAKYQAAAQPSKIVRVATRFINRIPLPPGESFEKTFSTTFSLSPELPQAVAGFLLRVVIPFEQEQAVAIVTQSLEGGGTECLFDLDVFAEQPEGFSSEAAWDRLESLRDLKNRLFFGSLTPEALEGFK